MLHVTSDSRNSIFSLFDQEKKTPVDEWTFNEKDILHLIFWRIFNRTFEIPMCSSYHSYHVSLKTVTNSLNRLTVDTR